MDICEVCGNTSISLLFDKCRGGEKFLNYICESCGFIFCLPRPDSQKLFSYYSSDSYRSEHQVPTNKQIRESERNHLIRFQFLLKISDELSINLTGRSCDIGCGLGFMVKLCGDYGFKSIGFDPSTRWTEWGKHHYCINVIQSSLEQYAGQESFDLITCVQVLEHVLEPVNFLRNIHSRLSDDGVLFLDVPGIDERYASLEDFFWKPHINTFSKTSLQRALSEAGFKLLWIGYSELKFLTILAKKTDIKTTQRSVTQNIINIKTKVDVGDNYIDIDSQLLDINRLSTQFIRNTNPNVVAVNIPFDNYYKRYDYHEPDIFSKVANGIDYLKNIELKPLLYCLDSRADSQAALWISKSDTELLSVCLQNMPTDKIFKWFSDVRFCITGRKEFASICKLLNIPILFLIDGNEDICQGVVSISIFDQNLTEQIIYFAEHN